MKLGLDSYSFHRFFGEITRWETPSETRWSLNDFLNFVSATSLDVVSLETCYLGDPKDFNLEALRKWRKVSGKEVVFTWGHPAGLNGGTDRKAFQDALEFLQVASQLNLPQMRIVLGNHFNFEQDVTERMNRVRPMIAEILSQAEKSDIRISIENHADFPTQTLYDFIEEFDHPLLGMCFDFANCLRVGDSPIDFLMENDLARISMIHVKDVKKLPEDISPVGWWPTVEWGTGDVGVRECLSYLREQGISSLLLVEISNLYHGLDEISTVNHSISFLESAMR